MGVITTYDEMRERLREKLEECAKDAKELVLADDVWGYEQMREDYALDVYTAVKKARDTI